MHIHILGICGTFMGGLAQLAKAAGHHVSGADANVYPPMSTQLEAAGIQLIEGYDPAQLDPAPDVVVVGNVMKRGLPIVEALLNSGIPYTSGPQWLAENLLHQRWVLGVAGTHGKTTTSAMLAWVLECAGMAPGFLIGGVPENFGCSARLGDTDFFVIEADEYDTAFFDKRSKFVHYRPRTAILNNLEYDHADIFPDLAAIQRQFHHLMRCIPGQGRVISPANSEPLDDVLKMGCWSEVERVGGDWTIEQSAADFSAFDVCFQGQSQGRLEWSLIGEHNAHNAVAAIAAARHVGVLPAQAIEALAAFKNVKRRMELRGEVAGIKVYDDFAHHPTAIKTTVEGLRAQVGDGRIVAVLEPRSNSMRMGAHKAAVLPALAAADAVWLHLPKEVEWSLEGEGVRVQRDLDILPQQIAETLQSGDTVLVMSNGSFGNIHQRLLDCLKNNGKSQHHG
ncbi:UDP-N-acetylmuramate:L-alanyl-gamma-D-glutamyl-meso-diaminopimelate ligase [gamma proteobacterium HTCC5015]|nr:UDP-N-acetylmuramate:L-alanyl-gamma-D-glutamyl-meso-diaminopimelate ligase [gamma proteobacterium HTCC5015]